MPKFVANDEIFAKLLVVKVLYKLVDTSLFVPCILHFFLGRGGNEENFNCFKLLEDIVPLLQIHRDDGMGQGLSGLVVGFTLHQKVFK